MSITKDIATCENCTGYDADIRLCVVHSHELYEGVAALEAENAELVAANDKLEDTLSAERIDASEYDRMKRQNDLLRGVIQRIERIARENSNG